MTDESPPDVPPVIELRGVRKAFGRTAVLNGVDLTVPPGQTFAFLGRNGQGKTTTIRTLLGLVRPDAGTVRVLGIGVRNPRAKQEANVLALARATARHMGIDREIPAEAVEAIHDFEAASSPRAAADG